MTDQPEYNARGNQVGRSFLASADRYLFDFNECTTESGWVQFDTDQDASYFGVWVHPERREILTYAEGDVIRVQCPTEDSYRAEIEDMCAFYGTTPAFVTIDPEKGVVTQHYQDRSEFLIRPPEPE